MTTVASFDFVVLDKESNVSGVKTYPTDLGYDLDGDIDHEGNYVIEKSVYLTNYYVTVNRDGGLIQNNMEWLKQVDVTRLIPTMDNSGNIVVNKRVYCLAMFDSLEPSPDVYTTLKYMTLSNSTEPGVESAIKTWTDDELRQKLVNIRVGDGSLTNERIRQLSTMYHLAWGPYSEPCRLIATEDDVMDSIATLTEACREYAAKGGKKGIITEVISDQDLPQNAKGERAEITIPDPLTRRGMTRCLLTEGLLASEECQTFAMTPGLMYQRIAAIKHMDVGIPNGTPTEGKNESKFTLDTVTMNMLEEACQHDLHAKPPFSNELRKILFGDINLPHRPLPRPVVTTLGEVIREFTIDSDPVSESRPPYVKIKGRSRVKRQRRKLKQRLTKIIHRLITTPGICMVYDADRYDFGVMLTDINGVMEETSIYYLEDCWGIIPFTLIEYDSVTNESMYPEHLPAKHIVNQRIALTRLWEDIRVSTID